MTHGQKTSIIIEPAKALENCRVLPCWLTPLLAQALWMHSAEGEQAFGFGGKDVLLVLCHISWRNPKPNSGSVPSLPPRREKTLLLPQPTPT